MVSGLSFGCWREVLQFDWPGTPQFGISARVSRFRLGIAGVRIGG